MPEKAKRRDTAALIATELAQGDRPLTAYELLEKLRPTGVFAPTTVYRALDKLLAAGKIHRIESLNAFVACRSGEHPPAAGEHAHHHAPAPRQTAAFAICDRCGAVEEFVDGALFAQLEDGLKARRFTPQSSAIEVHGICAACGGA